MAVPHHVSPAPPPGAARELASGLRRQANVVFALVFKEFKTQSGSRRSALGLLWVLLEPAAQTVLLSAFWYMLRREQIGGVNIMLFVAVGAIPYSIIQRSLGGIPRALKANEAFYNYQQVKPIDSVIARFILEWLLLMAGGAMTLFLLAWYMELVISFDRLLELAGMLLLASALGFGAALMLATYGMLYDAVNRVAAVVSRALMFVSAVFYSVAELPTAARQAIAWNPAAQIVEYARHYALGTHLFREADLRYAMASALVAVFLGLTGYYANRQRLMEKK